MAGGRHGVVIIASVRARVMVAPWALWTMPSPVLRVSTAPRRLFCCCMYRKNEKTHKVCFFQVAVVVPLSLSWLHRRGEPGDTRRCTLVCRVNVTASKILLYVRTASFLRLSGILYDAQPDPLRRVHAGGRRR